MKLIKFISPIVLILFLVLQSCADHQQETSEADRFLAVEVAKPTLKNGLAYFSVSGKIEAEKHANISTRIMGYVMKVYVKVGDTVKKGQALIDINDAEVHAKMAQNLSAIQEAKAAFIMAEKDFIRYRQLFDQGSASQKELDDVQTHYHMVKSRYEATRQMQKEIEALLSYTNIKAPFAGVITSKNIQNGDMTQPGRTLLTLENQEKYRVMTMLAENDIHQVKPMDTVHIKLKNTNQSRLGLVKELSTSSLNTGGQYMIKIDLLDKVSTDIYSGMYVNVIFSKKGDSNQPFTLPLKSVVTKGDLKGVYTVSESNTAILRWLKLGRVIGEHVEVLSGMSAEETYIVSAQGKLYNGVQLKIKQ